MKKLHIFLFSHWSFYNKVAQTIMKWKYRRHAMYSIICEHRLYRNSLGEIPTVNMIGIDNVYLLSEEDFRYYIKEIILKNYIRHDGFARALSLMLYTY